MIIDHHCLKKGLAFSLILLLPGCAGLNLPLGAATVGAYATRPEKGKPADLSLQTKPHQTWCYRTLADTECFPHPMDGAEGRLIAVDPQSETPLTSSEHTAAVDKATGTQ